MRKLPPFVTRERSRHGKLVFYFRRWADGKKGPRIRLPMLNDAAFWPAYQAALGGVAAQQREAHAKSLAWLVAEYKRSSAWKELAESTRRSRDNILKGVLESAGKAPYRSIQRKHIIQGRNDRTPVMARIFVDVMRHVFQWALEEGHVDADPTAGIRVKRPKSEGFKPWTEEDVATYETRWPSGTRQRVWLHVLLYTGLRRGDAAVLGRQHVRNGVATLRTEKTGTEVSIPILPVLAETLSIGPTGDLAFIVGQHGQPFTKESFGNEFREACRAAGIEKSAHGLRKIAAIRCALAGATVNELEALFGWAGGGMASLYTKMASRRLLAKAAMDKVAKGFE